MRAAVEYDERVHLGAKVDVGASRRIGRIELHLPCLRDADLAEEIDVGDQVATSETPLAHLDEELGPTVSVEAIARFPISLLSIPCLHHRGIADATDRVVPATAVFDDRNEDAPHIGVADVTTGQERRVLRLERIGHVVALELLVRVEEERGAIAATTTIGQSQRVLPGE